MTQTNNTVVEGTKVRFWFHESDASIVADLSAKSMGVKLEAVEFPGYGWLIRSEDDVYFDVDGIVPGEVIPTLERSKETW